MIVSDIAFNHTDKISSWHDEPATTPLFIGYTNGRLSGDVLARLTAASQISEWVNVNSYLSYAIRHFFDNGGLNCFLCSIGEDACLNATARVSGLVAGLNQLQRRPDLANDRRFGVLLAPELAQINDFDQDVTTEEIGALWAMGWQALLALASVNQGRVVLLDLPDSPEWALALLKSNIPSSTRGTAAAWWPRVQTTYIGHEDPLTRIVLTPLGAVAGIIQRNTKSSGAWRPPANLKLSETSRPLIDLSDANGLVHEKPVCCNFVRSVVGKGPRLWGCRTLLCDEGSPWRYIQVRILVNVVRHRLYDLMRAYLFEPNTVITWSKLKGQAWSWLRQLWLEGAFYGAMEEDAFTIMIGVGQTMTEEDVRAGRVIMNVGLSVMAPAEFLEFSMTLDLHTGFVPQ